MAQNERLTDMHMNHLQRLLENFSDYKLVDGSCNMKWNKN